MKINVLENGKAVTRDMTPEEEAEFIANQPEEATVDNSDALQTFFEGLANSETNTITKIRALAKEFIANTN